MQEFEPITRASSPYMDSILGQSIRVLNHGFARVVDYLGDDAAIVQAARTSYGKGTKTPSDDAALINYLLRHKHTSPFEQCEIKLHLKMPIFVARQWIRHRTASLNEVSARYSEMTDEFYLPNNWKMQSAENKQGSGENLSFGQQSRVDLATRQNYEGALETYRIALDEGVSREQARINMPLASYTEMYWKIDLHNLLHFLRLRLDSHAQYEIRVYAQTIAEILRRWVPVTWSAFEEHQLYAVTFSKTAVEYLRKLLFNAELDQKQSRLPKREYQDFVKALHL